MLEFCTLSLLRTLGIFVLIINYLYFLSLALQSSSGGTCCGRFLLEVEDGSVLTVIGQNGDPDLQLLCIQMHRAELHHSGRNGSCFTQS